MTGGDAPQLVLIRHGSQLKPAGMPGGSEGDPAWEPAQAGWRAGWLGQGAGMGVGLCRLGCRMVREATWHGSQPIPAGVPAGSGADTAWRLAQAGCDAGWLLLPASLRLASRSPLLLDNSPWVRS